jgi:hypothetical protein
MATVQNVCLIVGSQSKLQLIVSRVKRKTLKFYLKKSILPPSSLRLQTSPNPPTLLTPMNMTAVKAPNIITV